MEVAVLGPVRLLRDGRDVELGTPKQRGLLAALAMRAGRPVAPDALVDLLWGQTPPAAVTASLQAYVAGLRRALEPQRAARSPATVLVTSAAGYTLNLSASALDVARFSEAVQRARRRLLLPPGELPLPPTGLSPAELARLETDLRAALQLWVGLPYADLRDADEVVAERSRLSELRLVAVEDLALVRLTRGEHAAVAAELEALTREHPLREPLRALHVLALAAAGRQADALAALRSTRAVLSEELGVDPGAALQALETAVLRQDPRLQRAAGGADAAVAAPRAASQPDPPAHRPRLVGRVAELAVLDEVLAAAAGGTPSSALVVGEPGIGKTRLVEEVAFRARAAGFAVLTGRCSRDEGAPPLWPWTGVLRDLAAAVPVGVLEPPVERLLSGGADPDGLLLHGTGEARFRTGEAVVRMLAAAAEQRPLLVVLDDLHWADASSLRLLGQVVEDLPASRVAVVVTRRPQPAPTGALAEVGEVLVRRGARRLDVVGLSTDEVAQLVALTGSAAPDARTAEALRARTEGNALFVVELVRLGAVSDGMAVPSAVTDVVTARVAQLPTGTRDVLQTAAVLGRRFDLDLLAAVSGLDEDAVLDALEAAVDAGVVLEEGVGSFRFSHALVAEAVSLLLPATRRARRHAAAAAALESGRGAAGSERRAETARHWLAAGPGSARRAWQAAEAAADQALQLYAHEEAAALLAAALDALAADRQATPEDRYRLLLARAEACRWSADRQGLDDALRAAVGAARQLGDVEALVRAASGAVEGLLWMPRPYGVIDDVVLSGLQDALRALPASDSALRCRAQVALAAELYYAPGIGEREALAEEGVAMARRLGDPALLGWACGSASTVMWRPARLVRRLELTEEALTVAERSADLTREAFARAARALALHEVGRIEEMRGELSRARALAEQARLPYPLVVLGWLDVAWLGLQGQFEEAEEMFAHTLALAHRTSMPEQQESAAAALIALRMAQGRSAEMVPTVEALRVTSPIDMQTPLVALLVQSGRLDDAQACYRAGGLPPGPDDWMRLLNLALAAHAALPLRLAAEAVRVYEQLAPYAGYVASGGSGAAQGPVDSYLACAAAAAGEGSVAARHADDALALCASWQIPVAARWLEDQRDRFGF